MRQIWYFPLKKSDCSLNRGEKWKFDDEENFFYLKKENDPSFELLAISLSFYVDIYDLNLEVLQSWVEILFEFISTNLNRIQHSYYILLFPLITLEGDSANSHASKNTELHSSLCIQSLYHAGSIHIWEALNLSPQWKAKMIH